MLICSQCFDKDIEIIEEINNPATIVKPKKNWLQRALYMRKWKKI